MLSHLNQWIASTARPGVRSSVFQFRDKTQAEFRCPDCDKAYFQKHHLARHQRFECGKEPQFQCPHCPKRCRHKYHLTSHMVNKHREFLDGRVVNMH
ncbi:hypothetical protein J6590_002362 [Homalodisca vitripennis]|nr:hypothetical protein J6590_002362 [Homalodisca vitripennis]